eukprot:TRINITY_DN3227_c0_g2_i9.p1 TRINITY_DN3227_c0_g2~~TRINITY_DN3227_c0_g2_i9.p1  ORF type:complete len:382 (+),score=51.03 TRINITY_DN3227_c0_g2_i9:162-1307(+)
MAEVANRDEGLRCIQIGQRALADNDFDKAEKFAQKALKLYPSEEVKQFIKQLSSAKKQSQNSQNGFPASNSNQPNQNQDQNQNKGGSASGQGLGAGSGVESRGTPEQRKMVSEILRKKDYYEILGISKDAKDEDIKKAYRKLALKLHPDKCQISGAEEAFKLVSKSFACLSDPNKRAYYDRTGYENMNAAAASRGEGGMANMDEIDPQELFNQMFGQMFFGQGLFPNTHFRVYRNGHMYQAGGMPRRQQAPPSEEERRRDTIYKLVQFLPILLILIFTFMSDFRQEPVYSLRQTRHFGEKLMTFNREIPYYVQNIQTFENTYPPKSNSRRQIERQVEINYKEMLEQKCYQEQVREMQNMYAYGRKSNIAKPNCDELKQRYS